MSTNVQQVKKVTNVKRAVIHAINHNEPRMYHSQPMPRSYSTIVKMNHLVGASQMQLAFINAVAKQ